MTGIELCREIHEQELTAPYFILVTGRVSTADLVAGISSGADDFIAKPFNGEELKVRLMAGQRTIELRDKLQAQSVELQKQFEKQEQLAQQSLQDLQMASDILSDQLPSNLLNNANVNVFGFLKPASTIGGDFYNHFWLDDEHIGFYLLDVVGHGVPAALFAFMLAKTILPSEGLLIKNGVIEKPSQVARALNEKFTSSSSEFQYFTMCYGVLNVKTGAGKLCQAGSPYPVVVRADGSSEKLGNGGYPIGMIPAVEYEDVEFELSSGSRFLLYSDGITEAENEQHKPLGLDGLLTIFKSSANTPLDVAVKSSYLIANKWSGSNLINDDVSMLAIEIS